MLIPACNVYYSFLGFHRLFCAFKLPITQYMSYFEASSQWWIYYSSKRFHKSLFLSNFYHLCVPKWIALDLVIMKGISLISFESMHEISVSLKQFFGHYIIRVNYHFDRFFLVVSLQRSQIRPQKEGSIPALVLGSSAACCFWKVNIIFGTNALYCLEKTRHCRQLCTL